MNDIVEPDFHEGVHDHVGGGAIAIGYLGTVGVRAPKQQFVAVNVKIPVAYRLSAKKDVVHENLL